MQKRWSLVAVITVTAVLGNPPPTSAQTSVEAGNPAPVPALVRMEEAQAGDHWTYAERDEITGKVRGTTTHIVSGVTPAGIGVRLSTPERPARDLAFDRSWNLIRDGAWRYSPHDGRGIMRPLRVGEIWPVEAESIKMDSMLDFRRTGRSRVTMQESVTTPAGRFDTYRIDTVFQDKASGGRLRRDVVYRTWYAPAINHWVKRMVEVRDGGMLSDRQSWELTSYGRQAEDRAVPNLRGSVILQ